MLFVCKVDREIRNPFSPHLRARGINVTCFYIYEIYVHPIKVVWKQFECFIPFYVCISIRSIYTNRASIASSINKNSFFQI